MSFKADWSVWDFHDRQNVSLHQSIRTSALKERFHYEYGVNLTPHLKHVLRFIRKQGSRIQAALRSLSSSMLPLFCQETKQRGAKRKWFHYLFPLVYCSWVDMLQCMHCEALGGTFDKQYGMEETKVKLYSNVELSHCSWALMMKQFIHSVMELQQPL